jgi:DNA gyrase/topoisomerase IV subunit B
MNILGLEYNNPKKVKYDMIIIATDADPDGAGHITSLLVNFFAKWFPEVIENKNLFDINLPLAACNIGEERKYFFSLEEFEQARLTQKISNPAYYKGLGSFNIKDWKFIFSNLNLNQIVFDTHSQRYLDIAFGLNAKKRKKWLEKT